MKRNAYVGSAGVSGGGGGSRLGAIEWRVESSPPVGYIPCKGQPLNISDYPLLEAANVIQNGASSFDGSFINNSFNDPWHSNSVTKANHAPSRMAVGNGVIALPYLNAANDLYVGFTSMHDGGVLGSNGTQMFATAGNHPYNYGVSFANNMFIVVGYYGITTYEVSAAQWLFSRSKLANNTSTYYVCTFNPDRIVYGNGVYVGWSIDTTELKTSTGNFATAGWTSRTISGVSGTFQDLYFDGTKFIIVFGNTIHTSTDGVTWTLETMSGLSGTRAELGFDGFGNYIIMAGGNPYKSSDFAAWTPLTAPAVMGNSISRVYPGKGCILAINTTPTPYGYGVPYTIASTTDGGVTWSGIADMNEIDYASYNEGIDRIWTDGATVVSSTAQNINAPRHFMWFSMGNKAPIFRPRRKNGVSYYPYMKAG